jgi:hypothetical protein
MIEKAIHWKEEAQTVLDVRPDLASGGEPFVRIMEAAAAIQPMLAALGLAALVGWLGQSTIGYLYKIVPFLVWQSRYGSLVGREKVPLMRELVHERWAWGSWWLINIGLAGTLLSVLFMWVLPAQIASGLLGAGFVLAAINIFGVIRHLFIHKKQITA